MRCVLLHSCLCSVVLSRVCCLGFGRDIFLWYGITYVAQHERAGLCMAAESFQHLRELDVGSTCVLQGISLPHGLQSAAFRDANFQGVVWLDTCKCAPWGMVLGYLPQDMWPALRLRV